MNPFRKHVEELVETAKSLHSRERIVSLKSVDLVGELDRRNASGYLMLTSTDIAKLIGLTPNQYWKRLQVARLLSSFPVLRDLVTNGSTSVFNLALVYPHVTQANLSIFLAELPGKTQRQVARLVASISPSGARTNGPANDSAVLMDHALAVAAARGRPLTKGQLLTEALQLWLEEWDHPSSLKKKA